MLYFRNMELVDAIALGFIQGITEFLPISSSGHLVLVQSLLSTDGVNNLAFDVVLHFATTAAVMLYFRKDLWILFQAVLRKMGRLPVNERDITLVKALVVGTIPAALLGLFLQSIIENYLSSPVIVAGILACTSIFFLYAEWKYYLKSAYGGITLKRGFLVGMFQSLALLPGMSRSGSTIAGGMLLGLSRYEATRFSFLLAIPITLGAAAKMTIDLLKEEGPVEWLFILIGACVAFVTALIVIHFFLQFIRKYTLWPFVWYGIILASMVGYVSFVS